MNYEKFFQAIANLEYAINRNLPELISKEDLIILIQSIKYINVDDWKTVLGDDK